ncbi:MAG TPA: PAS domain-containing protein [Vicinamibacterales bacterium]|nr:PAS domain-containing protein [Vicinamibacterales bacterium]
MPDQPTLAETIALLEATLDATHDGILVVDSNRRLVRYNRRFLEMFRMPQEIVDAGMSGLADFIRRELEMPGDFILDRDEVWQDLSTTLVGTLRFKDGRLFERFIAPHRVGDRIVGRVISYRDVGESVRAAAALEQHRAFLEKAQEVAHIGSWVADLGEPERLGWSRETHRIFGVPSGTFDGTAETFFSYVHPDDRDAVRAASRAAKRDGAPYDIEHRIVRGDGTVRWVHEQADVVRDGEGRAARMVGTVQDITERRLLEEQLRQSQKMEAIGRLAGGIAHDLNNALTAIGGYAELALGAIVGGPARADVQEIRRAAERAGSVTKQLLAFSRRQLLEPRVFSLNDAASAVVRLLSRLLGSDVVVRSAIGTSVPPVLGDPGQVEQAIINLAVNARDAMPDGGSLTLETGAVDVDDAFARAHVPMTPGHYAVLRVTDTGHGMSRETQSRIFEPFYTTKAIGKGTGLGLSMVYGTMKQIGGFIFVDSEIGRGTTFSLYFPPAPTATVTATAPPTNGDRRGHETLLVVEDEPAVRNLVASSLRKEGYHLLLASSAEEALEIVDTHQGPIDLVVTDAIMPGRSGVDLVRELTGRQPGLPVILMSGYTEETLPLRDLGDTITLLQKPFTPKDLRRRIRGILDR